jgi:hypothetical protein
MAELTSEQALKNLLETRSAYKERFNELVTLLYLKKNKPMFETSLDVFSKALLANIGFRGAFEDQVVKNVLMEALNNYEE